MFSTVIIEDDPLSREMLKDLLALHFRSYKIIGEFDSVSDAVKSLPELQPDLVFLDIELTDGKGFDVLQQLDQISFEVIIITMHDTYMLQAIKHSALDYLHKPVQKAELREALEKFERKISSLHKNPLQQTIPRINKLALPTLEGMVFINIADIIRLESESAYTRFVMNNGEKYLVSKSIGLFEKQLMNYSFFRVHHSHLINLEHIKRYVKGEGGYVIMSDNASVDVSRRKKDDFMKAIGQ